VEAETVIKAIDDKVQCIELAYAVNTYFTYFEQQGQFDYQIGKLAGDIYKNGEACVMFPVEVYEAAKGAEKLADDTTAAVSLDSIKTTQLAASLPKRKLTESSSATETTTLNNVAEC